MDVEPPPHFLLATMQIIYRSIFFDSGFFSSSALLTERTSPKDGNVIGLTFIADLRVGDVIYQKDTDLARDCVAQECACAK